MGVQRHNPKEGPDSAQRYSRVESQDRDMQLYPRLYTAPPPGLPRVLWKSGTPLPGYLSCLLGGCLFAEKPVHSPGCFH